LLSKLEPEAKPLTNEDLDLTTNLKGAAEKGQPFKPLGSEDLNPETKPKGTYMTCDFCGNILPRTDRRWIKVHSREYDRALLAIKREAKSERESLNDDSSQT